MKVRWRAMAMVAALSVVTLTVQAAGALQLRSLHIRDVPALPQTSRVRPLIVEIQSLNYSYCRENIARIAQWRRIAKKNVDVVMVSMDGPDQAEMLNRALAPLACDGKIDAARMPQYANTKDMPGRLRAVFDPGWQGEMPRTIILRPDGKCHAPSGLLTPQILEIAFRG